MKIKDKVLIVEDEQSISSFISMILTANGYDTIIVNTGEEALTMISSHCPDLIVLDLGLPDMDGVDIIKKVRGWSSLPIIVVSARTEDRDKVEALDAGADDYLTKPFRVAELRARVAAHLRRQNRTPSHKITRGGVTLDLSAKEAGVGSTPLHLTKSEYAICELLALHAGQTFSKEQIYEAVFGYDGTADDTAITQHIKNIRAKLRAAGAGEVLQTIWGVGYQWQNEN